MKMLVLGIDGGDRRIFDAFDMPNFKALTRATISTSITEDLWSRGWAEMLTNEDVLGMGGVYERPLADGTRDFTQRFGICHIESNREVRPLWRLLSQYGVRSGFMNVPGTFPASPVDGFMVSGAGAGLGKIDGIPRDLCSSEDVRVALEDHGYLPDTRFMATGIRDEAGFFQRLEKMLQKRVESFVSLVRKTQPRFAMLALMATTRVQYLGMSEIEDYINRSTTGEVPQTELSSFQQRMIKLYACLDEAIGFLLEKIQPERFILTADHGAAPFRFTVNVDDFLARIGLLTRPPHRSVCRRLLEVPKLRVLPYYFLRVFAKSTLDEIREPVVWSDTKAFGHRYVPGIYVNDSRFGGSVSNTEKGRVIEVIVGSLNASPEAAQYGMSARPFRQHHLDSPFERILPDVWIDVPDNMFFEGTGDFVEQNPDYGPIPDLNVVHKDMFTGIKGRYPIFLSDAMTATLVRESDPKNLTLVYRLVERTYR